MNLPSGENDDDSNSSLRPKSVSFSSPLPFGRTV
jgi:hypothetical protein